jgi:hypothetical protein
MLKIIKNQLKKSDMIVKPYYSLLKIKQKYKENFISDEKYIKKEFKKRLSREVNLQNPVNYNDKIQWLKLNWRDNLATKCADKYEVREIIEEKVGSELLNELYGVYESVDEIDIDLLPKSFVLKGTHGSGFNIICKDKDSLNWKIELDKMSDWLKTNYYSLGREWVYDGIKPRIICEKYIEEPETGELKDYKIFCFDGKPKFIQVDFNRFIDHKRNIYDISWNFLDVEIEYPNDSNHIIKRPQTLETMLKISKVLSEGFPHVRIDFYEVNKKVIFGEMTFFHGNGFEKFKPKEFEVTMGEMIKLPKSSF